MGTSHRLLRLDAKRSADICVESLLIVKSRVLSSRSGFLSIQSSTRRSVRGVLGVMPVAEMVRHFKARQREIVVSDASVGIRVVR